ncbi:hypothetical protein J1N35_041590 [Gossypium stocksii]|uniref:Uncharacterized protein n=1 Tax=Gossypium stocksii TaxID=47602 RepID=A0A9D3UG40_9ROSI|nr:hypothetical protein J1N35_041590 [Gossypium stocksii]
MVQTQVESGSSFLKLYVEFSRSDKGLATSTSLLVREARIIGNVDSTTTLLESSHYDISRSSMGKHSPFSTEYSSKDGFLAALKRYNNKNEVKFHVVKSKSEKFKGKCAVQYDNYS